MKKIFLLLISLVLFTSGFVYVNALNNNLVGKVIVIDVGHGGMDSGTVFENIKEKDINLSISMKLKNELIKNGVEVIMTREGDYDLSSPSAMRRKKSDFDNRIKLINESDADMYISIHINYLDNKKYYGSQVFYTKGNENLARFIQNRMVERLNSPMKERLLEDDIYMYKKIDIPGVLIECGFMSNDVERKKLVNDNYQNMIVDSIVEGLGDYY